MPAVKSRQEFYDIIITELGNQTELITDTSVGSLTDIIGGITAQALSEVSQLAVEEYAKTFFETANGPDVTGEEDELENLAVDHFGDSFARPSATKAVGTVTFSRDNADAGEVSIDAGTVVTTAANSNGEKIRFVTTAAATMGAVATSVDVAIEAETAGTSGNVAIGKIVEIETTLTDSSIGVTNAAAMSGGTNRETDAQYRETIRNLLQSLKGATLAALQATAAAVSGVNTATAIEENVSVIQYDIGAEAIADGAEFFRLPYAKIYIAGSDGTANDALVALVQTAIDAVRAAGVKVEVIGATALSLNWSASYTLDPEGPNYDTLSSDPTLVEDSMTAYVTGLAIGADFDREAADASILAIWGSAGTGDLTAFETQTPVGDISVDANEKLVPGTVEVV